jgi:hypothetical protein
MLLATKTPGLILLCPEKNPILKRQMKSRRYSMRTKSPALFKHRMRMKIDRDHA